MHVTLANGNTVKSETHLVSPAVRAEFDGPGHFWDEVSLTDEDAAHVALKRRVVVLRAKIKADTTAAMTGTTRTDTITVAMVPAGAKA